MEASDAAPRTPGIGFILIGGAVVGSQVRDVRLANELVRRGCKCHVWWAMDRPKESRLDPGIGQDWIFHSLRNAPNLHQPTAERIGRTWSRIFSDRRRARMIQKRSWFLRRQMRNLIRDVCEGVERDKGLMRRFARSVDQSGVEYLFPNLAVFAPYVAAAVRQAQSPVRYSVTFQGYEIYSRYAREIGLEEVLYRRFREAVEESGAPAIAVSEDYRQRVHADVGIPLDDIIVVPPGIPDEAPLDDSRVRELVSDALPDYDPDLPLISYVGRQDSEKGIDLLLYAARMLQEDGVKFQLAICGGSAFGGEYAQSLPHIADHLRLPVLWHGYMSKELRTALIQASHCTVYPSIHREPFGMVPVESMTLGTPAVVADTGGVSDLVRADGKEGGLTFRTWDPGDLADKLRTIVEKPEEQTRLAGGARDVSRRFSVEVIGDRILEVVHGHQPAGGASADG